MASSVRVEPLDSTLGATVRGVALGPSLGGEEFEAIHAAWLEHAVLVFPGQFLDDESHRAFSLRFGRLERVITRQEGSTEVFSNLSNVRGDGSLAWEGLAHNGMRMFDNLRDAHALSPLTLRNGDTYVLSASHTENAVQLIRVHKDRSL